MGTDPLDTRPDEPESLTRSAVSGAKWTTGSMACKTALQFGKVAIVAHILAPSEFGLMAAVLTVMALAQTLADVGFSNAIIARQIVSRNVLSSLYWCNVFGGVSLFLLVLAGAPFVAAFYGEPELTGLLRWAAVAFLIGPPAQQFAILLSRDLRFDRLAKVEISAAAASTVVTIVAAVLLGGALALVLGLLSEVVVRSILLTLGSWRANRPSLHFRFADVRPHLGFGGYQMAQASMNYLAANVDYLLVGRFLGIHALGVYSLAYQLAILPLLKLNPIVYRVAFPTFAKRQGDNAALRRGYVKATRLLAFLVFPILLGLTVVAPALVPVAFGDGWEETVELVQILAFVGILKSLGNPAGSLFLAKDRVDLAFKLTLATLILRTAALIVAVNVSLEAVAWSYLATNLAFFVVFRRIVNGLIGLSWSSYLKAIRAPAINAIVMAAAMAGAYLAISEAVDEPLLRLLVTSATGLAVLTAMVLKFDGAYVAELRELARRRPSVGRPVSVAS